MTRTTVRVVLAVCMALTSVGAQETLTMVVQDSVRTCLVDLPPSYTSAGEYGLVLCFHGLGGDAAGTRGYTRFHTHGDSLQFISVYPQGLLIDNPLAPGSMSTGWVFGLQDNRDVAFVDALLDTLFARYAIDETLVFVTGISNGGFFSDILGCMLGDRLTAIAPEIGGYQYLFNCTVSKPLPMYRLGTVDDEIVGIDMLRGATAAWVSHNNCDATPVRNGMCQTYGGCDGGVEVAHCEFDCILGGFYTACHTWPGPPTYDFSATEEILSFFVRNGLGGGATAGPSRQILRRHADISVHMPDGGCAVRVQGVGPGSICLQVFALDGNRTARKIETSTVSNESAELSVGPLSAGTYVLHVAGPGFSTARTLVME